MVRTEHEEDRSAVLRVVDALTDLDAREVAALDGLADRDSLGDVGPQRDELVDLPTEVIEHAIACRGRRAAR